VRPGGKEGLADTHHVHADHAREQRVRNATSCRGGCPVSSLSLTKYFAFANAQYRPRKSI
jgi:hypothetical protein